LFEGLPRTNLNVSNYPSINRIFQIHFLIPFLTLDSYTSSCFHFFSFLALLSN
jgi:hypothetical protein